MPGGSVPDITLNIVLNVQGLASVNSVQKALTGVANSQARATKATNEAAAANYRSVKSWGDLRRYLQDAETKLDAVWRAGVHLSALGSDLQRFSQGIIGPLASATQQWGDFEFTMNRAAAAAGIMDKTTPMYARLKTAIYDAAAAARLFPAEEIAKATYFWQSTTGEAIKTEADLAQMMTNVTEAMKTAAMTQTGYESVIKGAYSVMKQYGMSMKDIPDILHGLFVETQRTALEFPDLIQSFKMVGPLASALGVSFEDVSKTLGILGDLGQRGTMAGRGLSMFFTQMVRPAPKGIKAMNNLFAATMHVKDGYNKLVFPKGKFIGMEKFVTLLANATKGLTDQQKLNYITTIVGTQNSARIIIPLINAQIKAISKGTSVFKDSKYSLAGSAKAFEQSFGMLSESWNGVVGLLKETVEPIILEVGRTVAEALTPFVKQAAEALKGVRAWVQENPALVDLAVKFAAVTAAALLVVGTFFSVLGSLILLGAGIAFVITTFGGIILSFALLAASVAGFAVAVYNNTQGIRDALGRLAKELSILFDPGIKAISEFRITWDKLMQTIKPVVDFLFGKATEAINWIADRLHELNADPKEAEAVRQIAFAIGAVVAAGMSLGLIMGVLNTVLGGFWALGRALALGKAIGALLSGFTAFKMALAGIAPLLGMSAGALTALGVAVLAIGAIIGIAVAAYMLNFLGFRDLVDGIVNWFLTTAVPGIQSFVGQVGAAFQGLLNTVLPMLEGIARPIINIAEKVIPALQSEAQNLLNGWAPVWTAVQNAVQAAFDLILPAVQGFMDMVGMVLMPLLRELGAWFEVIWAAIVNVVSLAVALISKPLMWFIDTIMPAVWTALAALLAVFSGVFAGILKVVTAVVGTVAIVITDAMNIIRNIIGLALDLLSGNWSAAWNKLQKIVTDFWDILRAIIQGAWGVLEGIIDTGLGAVAGLFSVVFGTGPGSIYQNILGFLDTVKNFGRSIVQGIWNGINSLKDWLINQMTGFIKNVIPGPIRDALGIASPSKVMAALGVNIVQGLAQGITSSGDALLAMQQQTAALAAVARSGADTIGMSLASATSGVSGGMLTVAGTSHATLRVEVDVMSSDGSVDQMTTNQLADVLRGPDFVSALEHMATVD